MKLKIALFIGLAAALTACPTGPILQDFTARYEPASTTAILNVNQGSSDGVNLSLCGIGSFANGEVTVSLENAPIGVSISKPNNLAFNLASACRTNAAGMTPQVSVGTKDLMLSIAATAPIVSNQDFFIVFKSSNVTKKLSAKISIQTPPLAQDFTARYDPLNSSAVFIVTQGSSDGVNLSLCGIGAFASGTVTVSLENAPVGVSISKPAPLEFNLASACRTAAAGIAPQLVIASKDLQLSIAANAPFVSNQVFNIVFTSSNVIKKLAATMTITAPAL